MTSELPGSRLSEPLAVLRQITAQMTVSRDVGEVLTAITSALVTTAEVALARIWLYESAAHCVTCLRRGAGAEPTPGDFSLHLAASAGLSTCLDGGHHRMEVGTLKIGEIAQTRRALWTDDVASDPRIENKSWVRDERLQSFAGYPLVFRNELVGVLGVFSRLRFTTEAFQLLEVFASQASTAIKTARLFSDVDRVTGRLAIENDYLQGEIRTQRGFDEIVGESPAIQGVLQEVREVGPTDSTVLLLGETGTGKERIADALHALSSRRQRPMIRLSCGAIPAHLIESELFGHERGAFTGAQARRIGRFELADKSTLFLDEVGELRPDAQVALLRVLQEQEFERVGGAEAIHVDVRVVAATNRDLAQAVASGRFRQDLFYRLNVFPIRVPPLRERQEDIPLLVTHFLRHFARKLAKPLRAVSDVSMERLRGYSWPGNVRELQNVLERACVLARSPVVDIGDILERAASAGPAKFEQGILTLQDAERAAIRRALEATRWRIGGPRGAAVRLAVNPSTLRSRMTQLGIQKPTG
jgi:formate hydrogenlyase transcriptional activator